MVVRTATQSVIKHDITVRLSSGLSPNEIRPALGAAISASALRILAGLESARSRSSVHPQFSVWRARRTIARSAKIARADGAHIESCFEPLMLFVANSTAISLPPI